MFYVDDLFAILHLLRTGIRDPLATFLLRKANAISPCTWATMSNPTCLSVTIVSVSVGGASCHGIRYEHPTVLCDEHSFGEPI